MSAAQTDDPRTTISPGAIDELFAAIGQESRRPASTASPPTPPRPTTTDSTVRSSGHYAASLSRSRRQAVHYDDSPTIGDWCLRLLFGGLIAFGIFCLMMGMPNSPLRRTTVGATVAKYVERLQIQTREIQEFDIGMRAAGKNPLRGQVETAAEPDPETSRKLILQMKKESGRRLTVKLLRSLQWMELVGVKEGGTFFLDLPEMGAVGDAFVEAVLPCPPIQKGPGNVVTGVFAHEADPDTKILSVTFANGAYIKGVTDNHPFYSVDRNDFVEVGQMREGETVKVEGGVTRITKLDSRFARPGEMLYNLETHNEHVYQVTTAGVLVHNTCAGFNPKMREALDWLNARGFDSTKAKPFTSKFSDRINGMRHGNAGYRIEFDARSGAHINVFSGKDIGPHFTFSQSEADMLAVLRQLFPN